MVRVSQGNFQGNFDQGKENLVRVSVACSHTLYFLFKVRRARVIKINTVGELLTAGPFSRSTLALALSLARRCFRKERKEK